MGHQPAGAGWLTHLSPFWLKPSLISKFTPRVSSTPAMPGFLLPSRWVLGKGGTGPRTTHEFVFISLALHFPLAPFPPLPRTSWYLEGFVSRICTKVNLVKHTDVALFWKKLPGLPFLFSVLFFSFPSFLPSFSLSPPLPVFLLYGRSQYTFSEKCQTVNTLGCRPWPHSSVG